MDSLTFPAQGMPPGLCTQLTGSRDLYSQDDKHGKPSSKSPSLATHFGYNHPVHPPNLSAGFHSK